MKDIWLINILNVGFRENTDDKRVLTMYCYFCTTECVYCYNEDKKAGRNINGGKGREIMLKVRNNC